MCCKSWTPESGTWSGNFHACTSVKSCTHAGMHRRDLDRIRDDIGSHALLDGNDFGKGDRELRVPARSARKPSTSGNDFAHAYRGNPAKDVGIE